MSQFERVFIKRRGRFLGFDKEEKPVYESVSFPIHKKHGEDRGAVEVNGRPSEFIMFDWSGK